MNPYVERKFLVSHKNVSGMNLIFTIPLKTGHMIVIERVVWDVSVDLTGGATYEIAITTGTPIGTWAFDRMKWYQMNFEGNHWNEELNLPIEGGEPVNLLCTNSVTTPEILILLTYRYEKREAEGKTHG